MRVELVFLGNVSFTVKILRSKQSGKWLIWEQTEAAWENQCIYEHITLYS